MKKAEKVFFVQNLVGELKEAKLVALLDYRGLTVGQINELRQKIRSSGGKLAVVKNRLLARALGTIGVKMAEEIEGPTALVLAPSEDVSLLKTIGLPKFKFGFLGKERLAGEELQRLATLPGREQLLGQLIGLLAYPTAKLIYNLNFDRQRLIALLSLRAREKVQA
jgi:large subunit ribosomal protein L10